MKVDMKQLVSNYEGKPLKDEQNKDYTFRDAFSIALNAQLRDEVLTAEDKNKIFQISTKIFTEDTPDLTVDQLSFVKERAGKVHSALIYGKICEIIEGKSQKEVVDGKSD